jgi:two-component system, response regulator PdtaR
MKKCLIVDDNQAFGENLAEILADAGYEPKVVTGGEAALAQAKQIRYDVLISDMRMPVMSGAELVHRIRAQDPGLPAIVVTAYTNDDDLAAARKEGLLAVFPKPVPLARLVDLVGRARRDGLVAVVEDDPAFSDNLSEALRSRGFAAVTASSVTETERLGDVHPFAALVDLRVPGGPDGEAARRLARKFPGLPVLVITAHLDVAPPAGHVGLFRKPVPTADLLGAVEKLWAAQHG